MSKLFRIKTIKTTAYHPQTNGALEHTHQTIADYLKHFIKEDQTDWDQWLDFATFSYNTCAHTSTRFTPYELVFANNASLPSSLPGPPSFRYDDYISDLRTKMQKSNEIARDNLIESKVTNKNYADRKTNSVKFEIGDYVYRTNEHTRPGRSKKLTSIYLGPYQIIEKLSDDNFKIRQKNKNLTVHANRLKIA